MANTANLMATQMPKSAVCHSRRQQTLFKNYVYEYPPIDDNYIDKYEIQSATAFNFIQLTMHSAVTDNEITGATHMPTRQGRHEQGQK